jgi:PEP-CTERM motif
MRQLLGFAATLALLLVGVRPSDAGTIAAHRGSTDPTTEGFTGVASVGSSTTGPLTNDQGLPAWFVAGTTQASQYDYRAPGLTGSQQAEIASDGFTLTMVARVLQNGLAPAYTTSDPVTMGGATVNYAGVRWEVDLGINSMGDTVVVLANTIDAGGPGSSIRSFGASYTLTGSGSTYQTYQLYYNPITKVADLSVDGIVRLTGYTGNTSFYFDSALAWGAFSGGQGNFNDVQVQTGSVPEPGSLTLLVLGTGAAGMFGWARRSRRPIT